ncbi:hypothetical protein TCEA9_00090 [Thermobrachium celere]|nr:hypothetical protein TCEA9_00090 [Thermobrachium celere]
MVVSFVFDNFLYVPFNVISFTLIVGYILFLRSKIFAISLLIIPIYVFLYLIFKKALYEKGYAFKEYQNKFFAKMNEQLYNIELIKINSWFEEQGNELKESFMVLFGRAMQYIKISAFYSNIDFTISGFVKLLVLLIGGTEVIRGRLTIGEIITIERYFDLLISNLSYFF